MNTLVDELSLAVTAETTSPVIGNLSEPASMYHLLASEAAGVPIAELGGWLEQPTDHLLLVGAHLSDEDRRRLERAEQEGLIVELGSAPLQMSELQWLNHLPGSVLNPQLRPPQRIVIYGHR